MSNWNMPKRYIVTILCFFGLFNAYCMRVNLSVAIVVMANFTQKSYDNTSVHLAECPALITIDKPAQEPFKGETFNWDASTHGYILSAFFYGYFIAMLPSGYFAEKIGAVRLFGFCILSTAVLTLLTPLVVRWGLIPFLVLRFLEGLGEGACFPSVIAIISRWSPKLERSRITSIIGTGVQIGNVFSFTISGFLCTSDILGGWPSVFYFFGIIGCFWYILWIIFIYETPHDHPNISTEEILKFSDICYTKKNHRPPWKNIAKSIPFLAAILTNIGHAFGTSMMMTEVPTYLNTVLHFNIKSSGILSSLPNLAEAIGGWLSPFIADKLITSGKIGFTPTRRIFNSISGFAPSICLLVVAFSGCQSVLILSMMTIGLFFNGFKHSGFTSAIVDMTPDYAGVLFGISNGISNISGVIGPNMVGAIISSGATIANWSKVFYITGIIYFITTLAFALFGSSELQPWGKAEDIDSKEEKL